MAVYKIFANKDASIYSEFPLMNTGLDAMNEVRNVQSTEPGTVKTIVVYNVWNTEGARWSSNPLLWSISDFVSTSNSSVVSRFLIEFDQSEINYVLDNVVKSNTWDAHMVSYVATAQGVEQQTNIELWPVAKSWVNGTGHYDDSPQTQNGVSWTKRSTNLNRTGFWETSSFSAGVTASFHPSEPGGAEWYTGSAGYDFTATQSLTLKLKKI